MKSEFKSKQAVEVLKKGDLVESRYIVGIVSNRIKSHHFIYCDVVVLHIKEKCNHNIGDTVQLTERQLIKIKGTLTLTQE